MFTLHPIMQRQTRVLRPVQAYQNLMRNQAQFQSTTGFSLTCFGGLFPYFEVQWDKYIARYTIAGKERIRPPRVYKNKVFEDTQTMLVFTSYFVRSTQYIRLLYPFFIQKSHYGRVAILTDEDGKGNSTAKIILFF